MPRYCYKCPECGVTDTCFLPMSQRNETQGCRKCRGFLVRDMPAEGCGSMNQNFQKPIEMYSIAPNNAAEFKQLAEAGATFGEGAVPLAHNRAEKLRLMKVVDHVELS